MIIVILLSTWHDVQIVLIDIDMYGKLTIRNKFAVLWGDPFVLQVMDEIY